MRMTKPSNANCSSTTGLPRCVPKYASIMGSLSTAAPACRALQPPLSPYPRWSIPFGAFSLVIQYDTGCQLSLKNYDPQGWDSHVNVLQYVPSPHPHLLFLFLSIDQSHFNQLIRYFALCSHFLSFMFTFILIFNPFILEPLHPPLLNINLYPTVSKRNVVFQSLIFVLSQV